MLIRAATLPVFLSFPLAYLVMTGMLEISMLSMILLYIVITCIIMSLLLPLSFDLTHTATIEQKDPVQQIRNKSILFEFACFILGLPGFFLILLLSVCLEYLMGVQVITYYILGFLGVLILKVFLRAFVTVRTFT
ncbi:hypothetical protein [Alkalicoccobacillus plakortidis]|uniref:Uncharacterized protein n=1 Tax=Alkalicoccobacillus plakortidis TaxID=444060 RepID=A0ABT0XKJ8_9BACI|nr:hypothetical protein [Alkalicoccobacillus plakortidis]MCM2675732.1 hypothetical protein [Alkalicoccobacillus plakortidis]